MPTGTTQPPIELSNDQREQLEKTLAEHFEQIDLEHLLSWRLNIEENGVRIEQLDRFVAVTGMSFDAIVQQFVARVKANYKVRELVSGMLGSKPEIQKVQKLAAELGIQPPGNAQLPLAPSKADTQVINIKVQTGPQMPAAPAGSEAGAMQGKLHAIYQRIMDGNKWMGYLEAYKQLHESVHVLQRQLEAIGQALDTARSPAANRRNLRRMGVVLTPLVNQAREGADSAEFPEEHKDWVSDFGKAVEMLKNDGDATSFSPMETALEKLRALPNRQGELNKELVRCAKRLDREKLLESIDAALHDLRASPGTAPEDLLLKLDTFRGHCDQLGPLVQEHDRGQSIDGVLAGLQALTDDAAANKCREMHVHADLKAIADGRPNDSLASEAAEAARRFEAASALTVPPLPQEANAVGAPEAAAGTSIEGPFLRRLRENLVDQFPSHNDLAMLLSDSLGKNLDAVAGGSTLNEIAFKLVNWAAIDSRARLQPLLAEAVRIRPNNTELAALQRELATTLQRELTTTAAKTPRTEDRTDLLQFFGELFVAIDRKLRELTKQIVIEAAELAKELGSVHHGIHN